MTTTVSDHLVDILMQWGVDTVFGLPGDGINGLVEGFRKAKDRIRYVHCRREETAALAASAYAKFSGRLGVCFWTAAPGAVHMLNGLYGAKIDGAPVLALTGTTYHDLIGTHYLQDNVAIYNQQVMGPAHLENVVNLERAALAHAHCHHRSVLKFDAQQRMFEAMGLEVEYPKVGCCGQAGSFGYEAEHYDVSMKIAEQGLLPAVRKAPSETLIIADGFSCREQILHGAHRWAVHPAEILALAVKANQHILAREAMQLYREAPARLNTKAAIAGARAVAAAAGLLLYVGPSTRTETPKPP